MSAALASLYQRWILAKAPVVMVLLLLLVGFLGSYVPSLKMDASADALVLEGDKSLEYYREISKRYETEDFLLVTVQPKGDLYSDENLAMLKELRDRLAGLPRVSGVNSILDIPLLESPPIGLSQVTSGEIPRLTDPDIDKALVREELSTSPIYRSLLTSVDNTTTAIQVNLERDEKYFALLNARDDLRAKANQGALSEAEAAELRDLETAFSDYVAEAHERQADLVAKARAILADYKDDARVFLGGVPMIAVDMIDFVKADLRVFGTGILLFIVLLLAVIFRSFRWIVLPVANCLLTAVFMLGLLSFLDWKLTVISANFVALLLIITLSITIHIVVRYREIAAGDPGLNQMERVSRTAALMAKPCVYTSLTTLVAFASLVVSGIRPVIDFGWMMSMGVTVALVMTFVFLPCALMLLKPKEEKGGGEAKSGFTRYFAAATEHYGGIILAVSAAMLVVSVWGISTLKVENRFIDYFHEDTEIYQGMETIDAELGGTIPLDIIIDLPVFPPEEMGPASASADDGTADTSAVDDEFDAAFGGDEASDFSDDFGGDFNGDFSNDFDSDFSDDFGGGQSAAPSGKWFKVAGLRRVAEVHNYVDSLEETGKVLSLATFYELMEMVMGSVDDLQLALAARALPETLSSVLVDPYYSAEEDQVRISVRVKETSRSLHRQELLTEIKRYLVEELNFSEDQVHLTGMLVLYNNMLQSLFTSQIMTLSAVFVAILGMFVVLFRSLSLALIALTPNLLAAGAVLGGMGLAGIPLDMMTITIAAITVGIGVDDTIHYVHRFKSEFVTDRNYLAAMYRCHGSIGKAMYYTSVIIVFGFSMLSLSNFKPSIYFGLLTSLAMVAALLGAMLLLPKLILLIKPLGPEGSQGQQG
ncbi:MMPL family transporter [Spongiibacter taiwanensis]|uniref:efflux RND transporter permease subunit n=1 Tax=Spongiibacter taiwanensis TaxID=1748242 RepID=UPI00203525A4|nr:MMPL family transporter [Spongiibacter taiwanensis]USA44380.1 MMPL family transporter [Spongiibacter taiwanensis]